MSEYGGIGGVLGLLLAVAVIVTVANVAAAVRLRRVSQQQVVVIRDEFDWDWPKRPKDKAA